MKTCTNCAFKFIEDISEIIQRAGKIKDLEVIEIDSKGNRNEEYK